jgi:hypothetical protein
MRGAAVPHPENKEPLGYRELCAKLQSEKDPAKFQAAVEEINRLLDQHEKSESSCAICGLPVDLQTSKRDVLGRVVHESCYVLTLSRKTAGDSA